MAFYCVVTSVSARDEAPGHIEIGYEVREGDDKEYTVLVSGTYAPVVPTEGVALARRDSLKEQVERFFQNTIARLESRAEIMPDLPDHLVGFRVPPAMGGGIVKG